MHFLYSALLHLPPHPQISLCRRMLSLSYGLLHYCTLGVRRSLCYTYFEKVKKKKTLFAEIYQAQFSEKKFEKNINPNCTCSAADPVPGVSTEFVAARKPPPTVLPRAQERLLTGVGPQVGLRQGKLEYVIMKWPKARNLCSR